MSRNPVKRQVAILAIAALLGSVVKAQIIQWPPFFPTAWPSILHVLSCPSDGCSPDLPALLAQGTDGNLYGTLPAGGTNAPAAANSSGNKDNGTVFGFLPLSQSFIAFSRLPDPASGALSGLSLGFDGAQYGTTATGGPNRKGTIFKYAAGAVATLYQFTDGADGAFPWAPPVQAADGNLYGVTFNGTAASGVLYRLSPANVVPSATYTVIANLQAGTQAPLILGPDGRSLYGTTPYGGHSGTGIATTPGRGTVFRLDLPPAGSGTSATGTVTTVLEFGGSSPCGGVPIGPVLLGRDGLLYGTTSQGGTNSAGVAYRLDPTTQVCTALHNFAFADGTGSTSGLVQGSDGFLYGVMPAGGSAPATSCGLAGCGTFYRVNATGTVFQVLHNFDPAMDGLAAPYATPTLHTNGKIYGLAHSGQQAWRDGVLFSFDVGLQPFVSLVGPRSGKVGDLVLIIGQGLAGVTGIRFGQGLALAKPWKNMATDTYALVQVPAGAASGNLTVYESGATLVTPQTFTLAGLKTCVACQ